MTKKIVKWWQRMSFWTKIQGTVGSLGIGSELALLAMGSDDVWKCDVLRGATRAVFRMVFGRIRQTHMVF